MPGLRVAAFTPLYPPGSRVGAWLATHELLAALASNGHTVQVVPGVGQARSYTLDGVKVLTPHTDVVALVRDSDIVISHLGDNGKAHQIAMLQDRPSVRIVHGGNTPVSRLGGTALAVYNSHATAAHFTAYTGPSIIVHPPTFPDRYRTAPGDRVTLVNLSEDKGGAVFWEIAAAMPDVDFLGVRGYYGPQVTGDLPNVDLRMPTRDMRAVYAETRVLLMPSLHESWGMTAVEAMVSGIPVIAHPTPGLVECLGPAGVFAKRAYTPMWVHEIRRLLDPDEWAQQSRRCLARAAELDPVADLERFVAAVEAL